MVALMVHVRHDFESISNCHRPHGQRARVQFARGEIHQFRHQIGQIALVWYDKKFR